MENEEELREVIGPDDISLRSLIFSQHLLCLVKHGWYEANLWILSMEKYPFSFQAEWNPSEGSSQYY